MAALSRPSLRSSSRRINLAGLDELHATDIQHNPSPATKRGKHSRDLSSADHHTQPLKKQRLHPDAFLHSKAIAQSRRGKDFLVLRGVTKNPVAQIESLRQPDHLRPPLNGAKPADLNNDQTPKDDCIAVGNAVPTGRLEKRNLRSHDGGSRSKSELALYFSNYDELVSIEAKDPDFLTAHTRIHIVDEPSKSTTVLQPAISTKHAFHTSCTPASPPSPIPTASLQSLDLSEDGVQSLNEPQRIDFSSIERHARFNDEDPLIDGVYFKSHRRAERQEKQLRNIEKERAQHEKVQLERLLDGLKGHDWLRVMGISGITDSEKKAFEPKRDYFIEEVSSLIDKFKIWKEEEKRRKAEREHNLLAEDEEESEPDAVPDTASEGDPPDYNDVDAWAARQLHQEAISATGTEPGKSRKHHAQAAVEQVTLEKPFTSFYSKPYFRDAAIGKHRRGRAKFAFGQPLPNVAEKSFDLPPDILSQDAIAASARSRRRVRRECREH
ncbi:hypothetical protein MMC29_004853 [Sticta canariensis]|nr:hypothetical protein [Sticta canariensis]